MLGKKRIRQRGSCPSLQDSEVITMEIVGEFLGKDNDKAIANIDERDVCPELVSKIKGLLLGDKGYIRPI